MGFLSGLLGKRVGSKPKLTPAQIVRELEERADQELQKHVDDLARASQSAEDALKRFRERQNA